MTDKLPESKVKCGLLGFTTAFSIFGLTMFGPKLAAMAKDLLVSEPVKTPWPKESEEIVNGLAGIASLFSSCTVKFLSC